MILFETDRLLIRQFDLSDELSFYLINSHPIVMQYIRPVKTKEECIEFLHENLKIYQKEDICGRYAVIEKTSNLLIGNFSFLKLKDKINYHIGYALLPEFWGKGFASELVKYGTSFFFKSVYMNELFAITDKQNIASKQVLHKNGYILKGSIVENSEALDLFESHKMSIM